MIDCSKTIADFYDQSTYARLIAMAGRLHASHQDELSVDGYHLQRLRGGMNNALFRAEGQVNDTRLETSADQPITVAIKLFVPDERNRAQRELGAQRLLAWAGLDLAPAPLAFDETGDIAPYPALVCSWLSGEPFRMPLGPADLAGLLESFQGFSAIKPGDVPRFAREDLLVAWFHWLEREPYLAELNEFMDSLGSWLGRFSPQGTALQTRLAAIVANLQRAWSVNPVSVEAGAFPLRLAHVDMNLNNCIAGPDGKVRWVDWEFSGWGDSAMELADLRWHASLVDLAPEQHDWLRANYRPPEDDPSFWERVALWDALLLARWPFLVLRWLWSLHNGPDRLRLSQVPVSEAELWQRLEWMIIRAETYLK